MSRFLRSLLCRYRFKGHFVDLKGQPIDLLNPPLCDRCGRPMWAVPSSPSPRPTSSWRYVTPEDTRESIEAWRAAWAQASAAPTSPSPKAADTGSASAPSGASR